jgi:ubiquinone/menaquinone biosynthesis C-methylase UbiE
MSYIPDYKHIPPINWHILTPLYDFLCTISGLGPRLKKKVLGAVSLTEGMTVADIGCGTGVFLKIAKQKYPHIKFVGLDPDTQALDIAKNRFLKALVEVELIESFAEALPLADNSIDICFSTLAFHHMPNNVKRGAIQEMYRILKPNGIVVIADFGESKNSFFRKALFFETLEYIEGNFKGVIPQFLQEAHFTVTSTTHHFPGIDIIVAKK